MRKETANPQTMPSNDEGRSTQISSYIFFLSSLFYLFINSFYTTIFCTLFLQVNNVLMKIHKSLETVTLMTSIVQQEVRIKY